MFDLPLDLQAAIDEAHQALRALMAGDPEPTRRVYQHTDYTTLFGAYGGHETGWSVIARRLAAITPLSTGSGELTLETLAAHASGDLAYTVELEHRQMLVDADTSARDQSGTLRVTQIFQRDQDTWKIIHRHADPLTNVHDVLVDAGWNSDPRNNS